MDSNHQPPPYNGGLEPHAIELPRLMIVKNYNTRDRPRPHPDVFNPLPGLLSSGEDSQLSVDVLVDVVPKVNCPHFRDSIA